MASHAASTSNRGARAFTARRAAAAADVHRAEVRDRLGEDDLASRCPSELMFAMIGLATSCQPISAVIAAGFEVISDAKPTATAQTTPVASSGSRAR